jgi:hypothetical protein
MMCPRLWTAGAWLAPALFAFAPLLPASAAEPPAGDPRSVGAPDAATLSAVMTPPVHSAALFAEWEWSEFVRYWRTQFGKTTGVVGIVTLVALVGFLIIMSKGRTPGKQ